MNIAIIGLGLIGGSIGLKLKRQNEKLKIIGIPRREETIQKAIQLGAIDEGTTDPKKGVAEADIVIICTPINLIIPILKEIAPALKKGAIVTDVGSTKEQVVSQAEKLMTKGTYFVGGHPMAGKETTKLEAAEAGLFKDKLWIVTPTSRTRAKAMEKVKEIIGWLESKVLEIEPKKHDLIVAAISHLPLAAAAALVNLVAEQPDKDLMTRAAASGWRDTTRVASGDPILGVDMFTTNKVAVLKMLKAFRQSLLDLEKLIKAGEAEKIGEVLAKAKKFRDAIYG